MIPVNNSGRKIAFDCFAETLNIFFGKHEVSEVAFRDYWLNLMKQSGKLLADGWYDPPPSGTAILFGKTGESNRINFRTLRDESSWPRNDVMADWSNGFLFAYCSAVDKICGIPADFAITLYFGKDSEIINYFHSTYEATNEVLANIDAAGISGDLFKVSIDVFKKYGMSNSVVSITDSVVLDLGQSFPLSPNDLEKSSSLSLNDRNFFRYNRQFINMITNWRFSDIIQFTVEPQLRAINNIFLPQVTYHYLVIVDKGNVQVVRDVDVLLKHFGLIPNHI